MAARQKRSLDVSINLVPFIDLMSSLICFLIMTAVWNQVDRLTVTQSGGPSNSEQQQEENKTLPLNLQIGENGFLVTTGVSTYEVAKGGGDYVYCHRGDPSKDIVDEDIAKCEEDSLVGALRKAKSAASDQQNITVQCGNAVPYRVLVRVVDVCNTKDSANKALLFPEVAVSAMDN